MKQTPIWIVDVSDPDDRTRSRTFCAAADDIDLAVSLVRDFLSLDDGVAIEATHALSQDAAVGVVEVFGLRPGRVIPWPVK